MTSIFKNYRGFSMVSSIKLVRILEMILSCLIKLGFYISSRTLPIKFSLQGIMASTFSILLKTGIFCKIHLRSSIIRNTFMSCYLLIKINLLIIFFKLLFINVNKRAVSIKILLLSKEFKTFRQFISKTVNPS